MLLLVLEGMLVGVLATEMVESESVIHSLPHSPPLQGGVNGYPIPYSPLVYPPYGYPGYPPEMQSSVREIHDAIRTQDADLLVRYFVQFSASLCQIIPVCTLHIIIIIKLINLLSKQ